MPEPPPDEVTDAFSMDAVRETSNLRTALTLIRWSSRIAVALGLLYALLVLRQYWGQPLPEPSNPAFVLGLGMVVSTVAVPFFLVLTPLFSASGLLRKTLRDWEE